VNILLLILWGSGLIYGIIFSVIQSSLSKQILLKNEIGIALMLSGEAVKKKIKSSGEGVKEKIKSSGEDLKEKIKKENVLKKLFKQ
jgi:hypothetical protein